MSSSSTSREPDLEFRLEAPREEDPGRRLYKAFVQELLRRVESPEAAKALSAAELELIRKVASDNSITLASIRQGDFGETAKRAAEEFPFPGGPTVSEGPAGVQ